MNTRPSLPCTVLTHRYIIFRLAAQFSMGADHARTWSGNPPRAPHVPQSAARAIQPLVFHEHNSLWMERMSLLHRRRSAFLGAACCKLTETSRAGSGRHGGPGCFCHGRDALACSYGSTESNRAAQESLDAFHWSRSLFQETMRATSC